MVHLSRFSNFGMATLMLIFSISTNSTLAQSKQPNIIYIMADDLGYADLSCYGRKDYETPNLDKLASQGIKFLNAYSAAAVCTPTRAAFMTGRYPARTPVGLCEPLRGTPKDNVIGLSPEQVSIATLLKQTGYETALVGKWHLGFLPKYSPNRNGFDEFFGFLPGGMDYISHTQRGKPALFENKNPVNKEGYSTELFSERAVQYIKQSHSKPFFLSIQFNAPHWPWQAPGDRPYPDSIRYQPHRNKEGSLEKYAAMMKSLDDAVGTVVKAVDDGGLSANTIIIFTSDNGGELYSDMGIYSGAKGDLWEGGIRVPAFVRWPGVIAANRSTDQLAITMDWTATILAVGGAKPDPAFPLDGKNLIGICTGKQKIFERTFFWRTFQDEQQKATRDGNWKYLQNDKGEFLFDVSVDPKEKNDLKTKFKDKFEELRKKYQAWEKTVLIPVPL